MFIVDKSSDIRSPPVPTLAVDLSPEINPSLKQKEQNRDRTHTGKRREGDNRVAENGVGFVLHRKDGDEDGGRHRRLQNTDLQLIPCQTQRQTDPPGEERRDQQFDARRAQCVHDPARFDKKPQF